MLGGTGGRRRGDNRGWDGWMASPTRWTWVWVNSRSWWWTGRPGVLRFMGSQRVGHDWVIELNWTDEPVRYKFREKKVLRKEGGWGLPCLVQWIRICLPMQVIQVWSLVQEDPTCHGATKPRTTTDEPTCLNYRRPRALGPVLHNKRCHGNGKPTDRN